VTEKLVTHGICELGCTGILTWSRAFEGVAGWRDVFLWILLDEGFAALKEMAAMRLAIDVMSELTIKLTVLALFLPWVSAGFAGFDTCIANSASHRFMTASALTGGLGARNAIELGKNLSVEMGIGSRGGAGSSGTRARGVCGSL
jgi:hypothetical protein